MWSPRGRGRAQRCAVLLALTLSATAACVVVQAPAYAAADTATIAPTTGTKSTTMTIKTSAGCLSGATSFFVTVRGGNIPVSRPLTGGDTIVNGAAALDSIGATDGDPTSMSAPVSKVWDQVRSDAGLSSIDAGTYIWSFMCVDPFDPNTPKASFTAMMTVTAAMTAGAAGAWTMPTVAGTGPTATSTVVTASPVGSAAPGASVTFTATVSPAAAGSVRFKDAGTALGAAVPVVVGGTAATATLVTATLSTDSHSLSAVFTPTDATHFGASTSAALVYTITAARLTSTTMTASPQSPALPGDAFTFTAHVVPTTAVGTVVFKDGQVALGSVPLVNGAAAFATTSLAGGVHSIVAVFTPADPTAYTSSQSPPLAYTISTAQVTITTLTVSPLGGAAPGDDVVATASVQPTSAVGSVQFKDGSTLLGTSVPLTSGIATFDSKTLPIGSRGLTATFVPTDATAFAPSVSATRYYFIGTGARTTTVLAADPPGPVPPRTAVTVVAMVSPASAVGSVAFLDGTTPLGTAPVVAGAATIIVNGFTIGSHALSAVFTPTDTAAYKGSASDPLSFVVALDAPPVFTTPAKVNGNVVALGTASCDASIIGADSSMAPSFVWILDSAPIEDQKAHVLEIPLSYFGKSLQCQIVVSNARGTSRSPVGGPIKVGFAGKVTASARPALMGVFRVGHRVRVSRGSWSVAGAVVTYQWMRDGRVIRTARGASYLLSRSDRRHRVTCVVHATVHAYSPGAYVPTARTVA